ncbi:TldD/PmbA family protein [Candidatus Bathyarchaeota archaeon]|nr:TldD/PmbA family protein [Candidatus Bathyarchaeota archaeon]MBS7612747.1 TldD/PmbA family protein [Candidatus Bathyarchaeota archaeon]
MAKLDLIGPVEKAMRMLSLFDVDFYDVVASYSRSLNISILGKGIKEATSHVDVGIGVRVFKNKGMGIAFSQSLEDNDIEIIVKRAVRFARVSQPDPYFKGIPGPSKVPEIPGLCDDEIVNLTLESVSQIPKGMIEAAESIRRGAMYSGGFAASHVKAYLMTSTGVSVGLEKTHASAYIQPVYREGDDVGSSYEFDYGTSLSNINPHWIGRRAAEKAIEQFGSKKIKSGFMPLILLPEASGDSLFFNLLAALSGESAAKGRTFASGLLNKQIGPENLEVLDDGTIPGAVASSTYDGEGVPKKPLKVVEKGTVLTFLHNSYSAGIMNVESTGHAIRGGYGGYVGAGPSNIRVKPGDSTLEEMIAETKRGILVTRASFTPNIVSGEFSATIDEGFLIEDSEKKHPVKNLMAGGHILNLFRDIELISKEGRVFGGGHFFPAVKIREVKLSGF